MTEWRLLISDRGKKILEQVDGQIPFCELAGRLTSFHTAIAKDQLRRWLMENAEREIEWGCDKEHKEGWWVRIDNGAPIYGSTELESLVEAVEAVLEDREDEV